jgi:hypothetical protein
MATSYEPQATQMNEKSTLESFLDLTLTQHPCDEDIESWEVHTRLKIDPPQAWYYCISPNFHTLVILLQVDFTFGDELETIYEGYYEIEDTSIFTRFSIPNVGHYHWLHGLIRQLPLICKVDYLVCTIQHILNFL